MNGERDGWKYGYMNGKRDGWMYGYMEVWKDERRMNHRGMHGKMSGDMFEKVNEFNLEKNYCAEEGSGGGRCSRPSVIKLRSKTIW